MKPGYEDIEAFIRNNFIYQIYRGTGANPLPPLSYSAENLEIMLPKKDVDPFGRVYDTSYPFKPNWIISFLAPWKIPWGILKCASKGAINFHPAPPTYPGIGGYNYAIWNEDRGYAVMVHYMDEEIDSGKVIDVKWFDLNENDTVLTLKNKAITHLKWLFYDIMARILRGHPIEQIIQHEKWGDYKSRVMFQAFCEINPGSLFLPMSELDIVGIERKLRSTYFKGAKDGPYINVNGIKWRLIPDHDLT